MSGVAETFETIASQFGYLGIFVISVLGSVIPFVPLPYLIVVVLLSQSQDPLLLGLVAGAGGALGKLTSYFLGRFGYLAVGKDAQGNLDALRAVLAKYGALGVFVFAVTPLPDDIYVVPIGMIRLPFWRFFVADLAGKVVLSVGVAYFGKAYFTSVDSLFGDSVVVMVAAAALTVALSVLMIRADWPLAIRIVQTEGVRGLVARAGEVLRVGNRHRE